MDWSWEETFSEFENVLAGSYKTAWREVLADNLSPPTDLDTSDDQNCGFEHDEVGFCRAVELFVCKILDSKMPRDLQYIYMAPGGNHKIKKDLLTLPREHARRFKEMLHVAKLLPAGKMPKLSK